MKKLFAKLIRKPKYIAVATVINTLLLPATVMAQDAAVQSQAATESLISNDMFLWIILMLEGLLIILGLVFIYAIIRLKVLMLKTNDPEAALSAEEEKSMWDQITESLTDVVPVEQEEEILLDHEYDGIHELDNNLPPWWKMMFNVSIVFGIIYIGYYHFYQDGNVGANMYAQEMAEAEREVAAYMALKATSINEKNVEVVMADENLLKGEKIFLQNCATCHGNEGQGGIGPNMTDPYWIHGGSIGDIFKTVKYGVPQKGMISWETKLTPSQMQDVSSYIYVKLVGTEPANQKEPQGEIYERNDERDEQVNAQGANGTEENMALVN